MDHLHYVDYAIAAIIVLTAVYLFVKWRRGDRGGNREGDQVETQADARRDDAARIEPAADAPRA